ncbi:hypothetical protein CVT26_009348 [Gymnopilus dilepis]|uniref:XPG-I domain-containing protein n=1 Tax=Gymnopilus dilepis TaxID=231916 RepID=A0A409WUU4_9AGAR|nr:hypothetical protein CVT26_009348 [Gymnopilus dilepis]
MGIRGLWKVVGPAGERRTLTQIVMTEGFEQKRHADRCLRIGIDASIWMNQAQMIARYRKGKGTRAGENPAIRNLFNRLCRLLALAVIPITIFDGRDRPAEKRGTLVKSKQPHYLTKALKKLLDAFKFHWHTAPAEAEAELAELNRRGIIDVVFSEDVDVLVFGAPCVIRTLNVKDEGDWVTVFNSEMVQSDPRVRLDRAGMFFMAILCGGDYNPGGLPGCGPKTALILAHTHFAGRTYPTIAQKVSSAFPPIDALLLYAQPKTSWTVNQIPNSAAWCLRPPNPSEIVACCEKYFSWDSPEELVDRLRDTLWPGIVFRYLLELPPVEKRFALSSGIGVPFANVHIIRIYQSKCGPSGPSLHPNVNGYTVEIPIKNLLHETIGGTNQGSAEGSSHANDRKIHIWVPASLLREALPSLVEKFHALKRSNPPSGSFHSPILSTIRRNLHESNAIEGQSGSGASYCDPIIIDDDLAGSPASEFVEGSSTGSQRLPFDLHDALLCATPPVFPSMSSKKTAKGRKNAPLSLPDNPDILKALQDVRKAQIAKYKTVKNTENAYKGYLARGRQFLRGVIEKRKANGEEKICAAGIPTDELEKALDGDKPPNRYSALAVELFLSHKCLIEGKGESTAVGIHGAFCALWDKMDGDRYAGKYELNEATGEVRGCPARSQNILDILHCVKVRAKSKGASATRNHADAMTIEEIQKLMRWSTSVCPDELLTEDPKKIATTEELMFRIEHGFMRAFMSSAFTLWTRCFELLSLQAADILPDCVGPAPYYIPHFKVCLNQRKGWQNEQGYDGPRTSNVYDIYQQAIPEIDMYTHFPRWKTFLERYLGEPLCPEESLFPHVSVNGVVNTMRPMSYDSLQALLRRFCDGAGIEKHYTTHSFRRGGAQYRFMHAPIGTRWSLNQIRWWGGWASGEHVDTLIKYLVDSLQSFENGFGHSLHPIPIQPNVTFMGDHVAAASVTGEELRQFSYFVNRRFDDVVTLMTSFPRGITGHAVGNGRQAPLPGVESTLRVPVPNQVSRLGSASAASICQTEDTAPALLHPMLALSIEDTQVDSQDAALPKPARAMPLLPKVCIPLLGRASGAWRRAIRQWEEVDPATGKALKDWPPDWYRDEQRLKVGSARSQRQVIYEEFERLGRDYDRFLAEYPDADKSMKKLLTQIRQKKNVRRSSKNRSVSPKAKL